MLCLGKRHAHLGPQTPLTGPLSPWSLTSSRVDSIMLVEEGFSVTSVDASDKMLKYALKERWNRRKEPAFDKWGMSVQPCPWGMHLQGHSSVCPSSFMQGGLAGFPQGKVQFL